MAVNDMLNVYYVIETCSSIHIVQNAVFTAVRLPIHDCLFGKKKKKDKSYHSFALY